MALQSQLRIERLRLEMIEFKRRRDLAPRFALQAVDAAEIKLVAQPPAITFIRGIVHRPVASLSLRFLLDLVPHASGQTRELDALGWCQRALNPAPKPRPLAHAQKAPRIRGIIHARI